ncbi:MAG: acetolactate synthase small subunit [Armatimonadetes bacterium]|nr:acetolactate synthase small subunit [Armatimonadota bacterium]
MAVDNAKGQATQRAKRHAISVLVDNRPRVLARVAGLFARRGYNIDALAVSTTENPDVSRMTITVTGDERTLDQICKQLAKLVDVRRVIDHTGEAIVERELCLVKVETTAQTRRDILDVVNIFRGEVIDVGNGTMIVEVTGDEKKIDVFVHLMSEYGIKEMVRTGRVVLARGLQLT